MGTEFNTRQAKLSVGTTSVEVAGINPNRQEIYLKNISTGGQTITLSFGFPAVANEGIVLSAGQSYLATIDARYTPFRSRINAISSASGGLLAVYER